MRYCGDFLFELFSIFFVMYEKNEEKRDEKKKIGSVVKML